MMDPLLDATYRAEREHFWFRGLDWFSAPLIQRAVGSRLGPEILDCGFGTGRNMARLSRFGRVSGFDLSLGGVGYARGYGQTRLVQGSVTAIPFASERFDLVTAFDILACLEEDQVSDALSEIWRVLKPGGAIFLNTAALRLLRGSHAVFGNEVHRTSRPALRAALVRRGFRIDRLTYTNCSLFPVMLLVRLSQRAFGLSSPEESGGDIVVPPSWINASLASALALESMALQVTNMPVGSSLMALAFKP